MLKKEKKNMSMQILDVSIQSVLWYIKYAEIVRPLIYYDIITGEHQSVWFRMKKSLRLLYVNE